jgi:hypothetical protein
MNDSLRQVCPWCSIHGPIQTVAIPWHIDDRGRVYEASESVGACMTCGGLGYVITGDDVNDNITTEAKT